MMFGLLSQKRIPNSQALKDQNAELIDRWVHGTAINCIIERVCFFPYAVFTTTVTSR